MSQPLPPILNPNDPLRPYSKPTQPKKKVWEHIKPLRKFLTGFFLVAALLFSLLIIVAGVMEEKIGGMVVTAVNKELKTKLSVKDFSLSLISGFPNATAELDGVFLKDAFGGDLIKAKTIALQFSVLSIFKNNISVEAVVIKDGIVVLKTDASGRTNFDIVKPSDNKKSSSVALSIEKARLQNVRVIYINAPSAFNADLVLKDAFVSGNFGANQFALKTKTEAIVSYFEYEKNKYFNAKPLSFDGKISVDLIKNIYTFDNLNANIADNPLQANGLIQLVPNKGTFLNIVAQNREGSLAKLFQLLPPQYAAYTKDFESSGNFSFNTNIKGLVNKTQTPDIQVVVHFKNGTMSSPKLKENFKNVSFDASFFNKKSVLEIENCKATFANNPVEMRLRVVNLKDPSVSFAANGSLPMAMAFGLLNNSKVTEGTGMVRCNNLKINGRYAEMKGVNALKNTQASGDLTFENVNLKVNGEPLGANGSLNFNNNNFTIKNFNLKGAGSDATLTGVFSNWLPVLLSDETNKTDLTFQATLNAERLDIAALVALGKPKPQPVIPQSYDYATKGLPTPQYRKSFPILNRLRGHFESNIKNFTYNKIVGQNYKGSLDLLGNDLLLRGGVVAMGGNWNVDGTMALDYRPHLTTKLTTNQVNITEFFRQTDNFGQNVLKCENLSGRVNLKMVINAYWDEGLNFMTDKLHVLGDVNVTNGELVGLKMLESFSNYVNIQDLRRIKFTNLNNQFEIYHRSIHIPVMFIQSNALNLQISGEHSFDQNINYNLIVNAGQVLLSKFLRNNSSLDPQPDQRNGLFNLYYNIGGSVNKYEFSSNKNGVKTAFAQSEQHKNDIRLALAKVFGSNISETANVLDDKNKMNPITNRVTTPQYSPQNSLAKKQKDETPEYLPGF